MGLCNDEWLEHLPRWIFASCSKAFNDRIQGGFRKLPLYIEGTSRRTESEVDYLEFRLDGPYVNQHTSVDFCIDFEINLAVMSQVDPTDIHKIYKDCGVALRCFRDPIPIIKFGDGPCDDGSILECALLVISNDAREAVRVSHFGKLDPNKQVLQSSVEGHYHFLVTR